LGLSDFVKKKEHHVSIASSYLPKRTKEKYKTVSAYFHSFDWNLIERISKQTKRSKTDLIREAIKEYLIKCSLSKKQKELSKV